MIYRKDRYGNDISLLGFGCMRFTQSGGKIDINKAETEIMEVAATAEIVAKEINFLACLKEKAFNTF